MLELIFLAFEQIYYDANEMKKQRNEQNIKGIRK